MGFRGTVKQKKRPHSRCQSHYKQARRGLDLRVGADWPRRDRPASPTLAILGSSGPVSDADGSEGNGSTQRVSQKTEPGGGRHEKQTVYQKQVFKSSWPLNNSIS